MIRLTDPRTGDTFEVRTLEDKEFRYLEGVGMVGYYVWTAYHTTRDVPRKSTPRLWGPTDAFGYCRQLDMEAGPYCDRVLLWGWKREVLDD